MKKHIAILLKAEEARDEGRYPSGLMWDRSNDDTIWISTCGYKIQAHHDLEAKLLKAGCRYDFSHELQKFTSDNGRTITYFKEPKAQKAVAS